MNDEARRVTKPSRRSDDTSGQPTSSRSPSGSPRTERRDRDRAVATQTPFLERYRSAILGIALVAGVALVGGFIFLSATSPSYACSTEFQPTAPDPEGLGAVESDMGRSHVPPGESVRYTYCPPASGSHVNLTGQGPIQARFYGPNDNVVPQGWIHNLEHGGLVLLYRCDAGGCDDASQAALRQFYDTFPPSPICNVPRGKNGPVVARFDQMPKPYAALVWGRVLYLDTLDTAAILHFWAEEGERSNPEPQCAGPSASPSVAPSPSP
jgi:hypothetical protein